MEMMFHLFNDGAVLALGQWRREGKQGAETFSAAVLIKPCGCLTTEVQIGQVTFSILQQTTDCLSFHQQRRSAGAMTVELHIPGCLHKSPCACSLDRAQTESSVHKNYSSHPRPHPPPSSRLCLPLSISLSRSSRPLSKLLSVQSAV